MIHKIRGNANRYQIRNVFLGNQIVREYPSGIYNHVPVYQRYLEEVATNEAPRRAVTLPSFNFDGHFERVVINHEEKIVLKKDEQPMSVEAMLIDEIPSIASEAQPFNVISFEPAVSIVAEPEETEEDKAEEITPSADAQQPKPVKKGGRPVGSKTVKKATKPSKKKTAKSLKDRRVKQKTA